MTTAAPAADLVAVNKPKRVAGTIVTGHGFQHMYADGFLVLLPIIQDVFGMGAGGARRPVGVPAGGRRPPQHGRRLHGGPLRRQPGHPPRRKPVHDGVRLPPRRHRAEHRRPHHRRLSWLGSGVLLAPGRPGHPVVHLPAQPRPAHVAAPLLREPGRSHYALPGRRSARVHDLERRVGGRLLRHYGRVRHTAVRTAATGAAASTGRSADRRSADQEYRWAVHQPRSAGAAHSLRPARHVRSRCRLLPSHPHRPTPARSRSSTRRTRCSTRSGGRPRASRATGRAAIRMRWQSTGSSRKAFWRVARID